MMKLNTLFKTTILSLLSITLIHGKGTDTADSTQISSFLTKNKGNQQESKGSTPAGDDSSFFNSSDFSDGHALKKIEKKYNALISASNQKRKEFEDDYKQLQKDRENYIQKYNEFRTSTKDRLEELEERMKALDEKRNKFERRVLIKMDKYNKKRAQLETEQQTPKQMDREFSKRIQAEYNNGID